MIAIRNAIYNNLLKLTSILLLTASVTQVYADGVVTIGECYKGNSLCFALPTWKNNISTFSTVENIGANQVYQ